MRKDDITVKIVDSSFDIGLSHQELFVGEPTWHNIDPKKRVFIPSYIRDSLLKSEENGTVYFIPSGRGNVIGRLYSSDVYELMAIISFKKKRNLFRSSVRLKLDGQGRVNLSDYVDGYKSVLFIPEGDCVALEGIEKRK